MNIFRKILIAVIVFLVGFYFYWTNTSDDMADYDELVKVINEGYLDYKDEVSIVHLNFTDESIIVQAVEEARANVYYASGDFKYARSRIGIMSIQLDYEYLKNGSADVVKSAKVQAETEMAIAEFMSDIDLGQSQSMIALEIHDKLIEMINYDYEGYINNTISDESYTAFGALVNKTAVCDGYSRAYIVLLKEAGINAYYVGSEEMNHSWVLAKLDGTCYHIDITWDDPVSLYGKAYVDTLTHDYFMLTEEEISEDHYGFKETLPECN